MKVRLWQAYFRKYNVLCADMIGSALANGLALSMSSRT